MNEIKEDLNILELEGFEFLNYTLKILKRNFLNFLPVIILLILLNFYNVYSIEIADKFSESSYGMKIYRFFTDLKIGWFIDEGRGEEWAELILFNRFKNLSDFIYLFFNSIFCFGIVISVCKYVDQGTKTNPLSEIKSSAFKIFKFLLAEFLVIGIIVKITLNKNIFISAAIYVFLIFAVTKGIFFFQEYFYLGNSMRKAIKNSSDYSTPGIGFAGILLAYLSYQMIGITAYFPEKISVLLSVFLQLSIIILITLNYFNIKYLNDNKIQEEMLSE